MKMYGNTIEYENIFELNYDVLNAIGLFVTEEGYVYDQDNHEPIMVMGKRLKASIDTNNVKYPGNGDIMLDLVRNNHLVRLILGYFIEKKVANGEMTFLAQYIDELKNDPKTCLVIKTNPVNSISSAWYNNNCLTYINMILKLQYFDSQVPGSENQIEFNLLAFDTVV